MSEQTGRGFVEWRNIARLDRFQDAYPLSGDLLTAALVAGFGSYTQFHRVFLDMIGVTPGEWVRRQTDGGATFLSSMGQSRSKMVPGTGRLLWCSLAGASFSAADAWLTRILPQGTSLEPVPGDDAPALLPTGIGDVRELRPLQDRLVDELCATRPDDAARLRRLFTENDQFEYYDLAVGGFGMGAGDLGALAAVMLTMQSIVANRVGLPDIDSLNGLALRIRQCAAKNGTVIDPDHRREIAAGLVMQCMLLRQAAIGASGSGNEATITRVSDAARAGGVRVLRIDLRQTPLYAPRSKQPTSAVSSN